MEQPSELVDWLIGCWPGLWLSVLDFSSRTFKCIIFDVMCFYLQSIRSMTKLLSLFVIPAKYNNNFASDWLTLLARTLLKYLFYLYHISKDNYSKFSPSQLRISVMVSLYSMFVVEDDKTKYISNHFWGSIFNYFYAFIWACVKNCMPLFEHVSPIEVIWVW